MLRRARTAAVAALLVGVAGCCTCASSPEFTVRAPRAISPPSAPPLAGPTVRALHLGDFGDPSCQQGVMASAVEAAHARAPFDLAVFAGDLVYECGPDATLPGAGACTFEPDGVTVTPGYVPPDDPAFAQHEAPLAPLAREPAAEVWVGLGNHDVRLGGGCAKTGDPVAEGRTKACLNVARRTPLWRMGGRHYALDRGAARFLFLDSNLIAADYGGFSLDAEVAFVAAQSPGCRADACEAEPGGCEKPWCFLVAHHPAVTAGGHRDQAEGSEYRARVARVVEAGQGRLRAWLAGHDHDLQHLRAPWGMDVFVSGNGARGRGRERFGETSQPGTEVLYGSVHWGYGVLEAGPGGWRYRFESERGEALYCCAADGPGACEPSTCAPSSATP